jgi:hypothetical protein
MTMDRRKRYRRHVAPTVPRSAYEREAIMAKLFRIALSLILLVVHSVNCRTCSSVVTVPYRLGNFSSAPLKTKKPGLLTNLWNRYARLFHICVFFYFTHGAVESIMSDSWEAVRDPHCAQRIRNKTERETVVLRSKSAELRRKLVGVGYTPRLVWLYGLMLRGIIHCTALPQIFEPPIGFGAGAVAAARFANREWLPCIMLGWYGGDFYWRKIFGVDGAPGDENFDGVPITIHSVRFAKRK